MRSLSIAETFKFRKIERACEMQVESFDCGVACVLTIYKYLSKRSLNPEIVKERCETSYLGTNLSKIVEMLDELGVSTEAYQLESKSELSNIQVPALLHVKNIQNRNHYILLFKIFNSEVLIHDPAKGLHVISIDELFAIWETKIFITISGYLDDVKPSNLDKSELNLGWLRSFVPLGIYINLSIALTLGIIVVVIGLLLNMLTQVTIDDIIPNSDRNKLTTLVVGLNLALLGRIAIEGVRIFMINISSRELSVRLLSNFTERLISLKARFFLMRKIGDIIARINDSNKLQSLIVSITTTIAIDFLTVLFSVITIFTYSITIGIYIVVLVPIFILIVIYGTSKMNFRFNELMEAGSRYESELIDLLSGTVELKYHGKEYLFKELVIKRFSELQSKQFSMNMRVLKYSLRLEVASLFFIIPVFYYAAIQVFQEDILLGEMVAIISFTGLMLPAIIRLGNFRIKLKEAIVALKRISSIINLTLDDSEKEYARLPSKFESLNISGLTFKFNDQEKLIENLDLTLQRGEIIHIGGSSGQGKSSLFHLLLSDFEFSIGKIRINETEIKDFLVNDLHKFIGIVPQEIKIFNNSLVFNICLDENIEQHAKVVHFCRDFGFSKYFESFSDSYNSLLGEDGIKVSGGQRQMIGFARCLFRDPKIILLDESTSFVDSEVEVFFHRILKRLSPEKGIIVITHKTPDMSFYDKSYLMEDGKLFSLLDRRD